MIYFLATVLSQELPVTQKCMLRSESDFENEKHLTYFFQNQV